MIQSAGLSCTKQHTKKQKNRATKSSCTRTEIGHYDLFCFWNSQHTQTVKGRSVQVFWLAMPNTKRSRHFPQCCLDPSLPHEDVAVAWSQEKESETIINSLFFDSELLLHLSLILSQRGQHFPVKHSWWKQQWQSWPERERERQTDRQADRQTERQTDRKRDRQTDREMRLKMRESKRRDRE